MATKALASVLASITAAVEAITLATGPSVDRTLLPPFVTFMAYKAAAVVTQRLLVSQVDDDDGDGDAKEGLRKLKILRRFLEITGRRWLSGGE